MELRNSSKDAPPRLERSPHPYHRHKEVQPSADASLTSTPATHSVVHTPLVEQQDLEWGNEQPRQQQESTADGSDSGSEADDERGTFTKALPAPPVRARKGLRGIADEAVDVPPSEQLTFPEFVTKNEEDISDIPVRLYKAFMGSPEDLQSSTKFRRSRKAEFLRRASELVLMLFVASCIVLSPATQLSERPLMIQATILQFIIIASLCALYIMRLFLLPVMRERKLRVGSIIVPSAFDPAPLVYPTFIPLLVAAATSAGEPKVLLANCVLGLAALPGLLSPSVGSESALNSLHWTISILPAYLLTKHDDDELLTLLYPLLTTLTPPLHYLTTTSLLHPELRLLAISVVNVGLFSTSPHMTILSIVLWTGGVGLFLSCAKILKWNVALERIPQWRLRRPPKSAKGKTNLYTAIRALTRWICSADARKESALSPSPEKDQDEIITAQARARTSFSEGEDRESTPQALRVKDRSKTISVPSAVPAKVKTPQLKPSNSRVLGRLSSSSSHWCYFMTPRQAERRKWFYAFYTYFAILAMVLGPVRYQVQTRALGGQEPIGWAIGYLFGDLDLVRDTVVEYQVQSWVPLPDHRNRFLLPSSNWLQGLCHDRLGLANTRLLLFAYWAAVVGGGVAVVLWLSTSVEVDTRRKVFHGTMVLMLLPTAYVDPAFLSLGLVLVLAVFLLLDLIRAAQLRPLSKPLALFLTPYVDGRDLRGPVVVSHIFLLIGCAIPLWLSLVGTARGGHGPWLGWEVETRDVSMLAGVVCVGMGDAAASLIGRRYGRHKWPWAGGKSLEGSLAFAAAVTLGLVAAKLWLVLGAWEQTWHDHSGALGLVSKAWVAGCGASMTEAVLTGCNDNVVVPVVLWLLVRGLRV